MRLYGWFRPLTRRQRCWSKRLWERLDQQDRGLVAGEAKLTPGEHPTVPHEVWYKKPQRGDTMAEINESSHKDFHEWMVTKALAIHLEAKNNEHAQRMAWLFDLEASTPHGVSKLRDLCGFEWEAGKILGGAENSFKEADRGKLSSDEFKKYLSITPDFRYWTKEGGKHLIVEAKGTPKPIGRRDDAQAERYFAYLQDSSHSGAVVYFAPNPDVWLNWLANIPNHSGLPFGVVDLKVQVVPQVANELLHVVGEALVQTADLLKEAMRFSKST